MAPDRVQGLTMAAPITVACPMPDCGWTSSIPIADDYPASIIDMLTQNAGQVREHHINQHGALAWFEAWEKLATEQAGPSRGDRTDVWLKAERDRSELGSDDWFCINELLDDYRLHADTGTPLDQHCCEGGNVDDCAGCHDAKEEARA